MSNYEVVDQVMEQNRSGELRSNVSEHLGMELVEFGRGEVVYEMACREQLGNPLGVIQGGVVTALADAAMAAASLTTLTDEQIQEEAITRSISSLDSSARSTSTMTRRCGHTGGWASRMDGGGRVPGWGYRREVQRDRHQGRVRSG